MHGIKFEIHTALLPMYTFSQQSHTYTSVQQVFLDSYMRGQSNLSHTMCWNLQFSHQINVNP